MTRAERQRLRRMSAKVSQLEYRINRMWDVVRDAHSDLDHAHQMRHEDWLQNRRRDAEMDALRGRIAEMMAANPPSIFMLDLPGAKL